MKKIYYAIVTVLIILNLSGCKKSPDVTAVTSGLSFMAQINQDNSEIVCEVNIDKKGKGIFTVSAPEQISGFSYIFADGECEVKYKEITQSLNSMTESNIFYSINSVFEILRKNNIKSEYNDKLYVFSGKTEYGDFELITTQSGLPIKAEIEDIDVIFKNVAII